MAIALKKDFDGDAVADLELMVTEAWGLLTTRASRHSQVNCRLFATEGAIQLSMMALSDTGRPIEQSSFGWYAVTALTDEAYTWITTEGHGKYHLHIRIVKQGKFPH